MDTSMQLGATASQPGAADESSEESSDDDSASEENKGKYAPWQLSSPFYGSLCWIFGEPFFSRLFGEPFFSRFADVPI